MYLIIKLEDKTIIGSSVRPIDQKEASKNGYIVYSIPDAEFSHDLLGSKLESFDHWED